MDPFQESIRNFVLNDKEKFAVATSIYEVFDNIIDYMLNDILNKAIKDMCIKCNLKTLGVAEFGRQANYYWYRMQLSVDYKLHMESSYYFRTYGIELRSGTQGYDPNNNKHLELREILKADNDLKGKYYENSWFIAGIKNAIFELDNIKSHFDLYRVYKNEDDLRDKLCSRFNDGVGVIINKLYGLIDQRG